MLEDHPKVLIIGAGVSGLACARELTHRGYQVLIVEARDRVGGRIHSIDLSGNNNHSTAVDVGGALIHGIQHNPIHALTREMGVATRVVQDNCVLLEGKNGTRIDATRDQTVAEQFNACLEQTFYDIQTRRNECTGSSSSLSFGDVFDQLSPRDKDPLYKWHQANLELSCGAPLNQLGYEWNDDEPYGYDGSHVSVKGGWNQVMEGLSEGLHIMYSSPIQRIRVVHNNNNEEDDDTSQQPRRSKRRRCTTTTTTPVHNNNNSSWKSKTNGDKVHVTLHNGKVLETNIVVCTLPLGILKLDHNNEKGGVEFDPPLSREKQRSIARLGCGLLNKCVIQFPSAFWSSDDDFCGIVAPNDNEWPHLILCGPDSTTLTFLFGGAYAPQVEEWSDAKVMEMCMSVLHTIYSTTTTTTTTTASLPSPLDYHVTRWSRDVYARGAFVYLPPSAEMNDLERLSLPITTSVNDNDDGVGLPLVCFAGEHTTPYHPSTIHGAFNSGIREAYRLDLSYFPKYNNHLQFEPKQVYKKTFTVKPKFPIRNGSSSTAKVIRRQTFSSPSPKRRGRGNMTLRKRPRMSYNVNNGSTTTQHYSRPEPKRSLTNGHLFKPPTRRSDRVQQIPAPVVQPPTTTTTGSQQDRSLVRSYESCQDWQLVQSKVLPVFGTDTSSGEVVETIPTETQLRARYQELRVKKPRLDPAIVKEWLVVAPSPKRESERVNGTHVGRRRKSRRAKKTRVVVDV